MKENRKTIFIHTKNNQLNTIQKQNKQMPPIRPAPIQNECFLKKLDFPSVDYEIYESIQYNEYIDLHTSIFPLPRNPPHFFVLIELIICSTFMRNIFCVFFCIGYKRMYFTKYTKLYCF